jgi:hypothetical protein
LCASLHSRILGRMSVYNQRDKPAYGANAGLDTAYGKNPHILKWWTPAHDQLIEQAIQEYQWQWYWHIREKICALTPSEVLETWKRSDPACKSHAWYNVLMYFSSARAIDRGFDSIVGSAGFYFVKIPYQRL